MDPADFLNVASRFKSSASEAERRTCIGRAYYALYNVLHDALSSQGVSFQATGEDHRLLVYYLTRVSHPDARRIGGDLRDLRVERNTADYKMNLTVSASKSQFVYGKADAAVRRIKGLAADELSAIVREIRTLPPLLP